jgi:hypothetical protein
MTAARKFIKLPLVTARSTGQRSGTEAHWRPQTRAECVDGQRPCPFVGCRHHLDSDEHDAGHEPRLTIDRLTVSRPSCSLDLAESGRILDLEEIGALTGLWHNAVEDALASGLAKMAKDPALAEMFTDIDGRDNRHPLDSAQQWADDGGDDGR